jgi:hypothetical protein
VLCATTTVVDMATPVRDILDSNSYQQKYIHFIVQWDFTTTMQYVYFFLSKNGLMKNPWCRNM